MTNTLLEESFNDKLLADALSYIAKGVDRINTSLVKDGAKDSPKNCFELCSKFSSSVKTKGNLGFTSNQGHLSLRDKTQPLSTYAIVISLEEIPVQRFSYLRYP